MEATDFTDKAMIILRNSYVGLNMEEAKTPNSYCY